MLKFSGHVCPKCTGRVGVQVPGRTLKLLRRCLMEKAWPEGCTQQRCRRSAACFAPKRFPIGDSLEDVS